MRKSSKHFCEITESCRRWDCSMEQFAEWTFEGGLNDRIIFSRSHREPNPLSIRSVCQYTRKWTLRQSEWYRDNKNLLPSQMKIWGGFLRESTEPCKTARQTRESCLHDESVWRSGFIGREPASEMERSKIERTARCVSSAARIPHSPVTPLHHNIRRYAAFRKGEQT